MESMIVIRCGFGDGIQVLGAWGLGWEVWMDGMEITQFTYFQQVMPFSKSHSWRLPCKRIQGSLHSQKMTLSAHDACIRDRSKDF
jgi:hypothetical protein